VDPVDPDPDPLCIVQEIVPLFSATYASPLFGYKKGSVVDPDPGGIVINWPPGSGSFPFIKDSKKFQKKVQVSIK
jgi:hypothetical protein